MLVLVLLVIFVLIYVCFVVDYVQLFILDDIYETVDMIPHPITAYSLGPIDYFF